MKQKHNAGASLIEVLIAITILGVIVVPACSAMVMSFRMNAKTESMLQAQLAVSSAVEELMAKGFDPTKNYSDDFEDVTVSIPTETESTLYYEVTVESNGVSVTTHIHAAEGGDGA